MLPLQQLGVIYFVFDWIDLSSKWMLNFFEAFSMSYCVTIETDTPSFPARAFLCVIVFELFGGL